MKYERDDINELYKSADIEAGNYIEIKENEAVVNIKKKWPLVDEIISFGTKNVANQEDRIS